MQIIQKNTDEIPFELIKIGQTFLWGTTVFMRIEPIVVDDDDYTLNAVNIEKGDCIGVYDNEKVTPVKGHFVME